MKKLFNLVIFLLISATAFSQSERITRHMHSKLIGKDSVVIYFDQYYGIIEPDCAAIIRYGHFDPHRNCFCGKVRDVLATDTSFVISEGNYSKIGQKEGEFIIYYSNKVPQAKGNFKGNNLQGEWVFYYPNGRLQEKANFTNGRYDGIREIYNPDGSPYLFMKITGDNCEITDTWDKDGNKEINHGNGFCVITASGLEWRGNLLNGVPDGTWKFQVSDQVYGNEFFKKGKFVDGYNHNAERESEYSKKSRINLMPVPPKLSFLNSEHLGPFNSISCDGIVDYGRYRSYYIQVFD